MNRGFVQDDDAQINSSFQLADFNVTPFCTFLPLRRFAHPSDNPPDIAAIPGVSSAAMPAIFADHVIGNPDVSALQLKLFCHATSSFTSLLVILNPIHPKKQIKLKKMRLQPTTIWLY